jgi:Flp pilus assembly protein TadD
VPYRTLGATRIAAKDIPGAIAAYQEGIKLAPAEPRLISELAELYQSQGRADEAIACYEEGYRQNPRSQLLANNLAMLLVTYRTDQKSLDRARDLTEGFVSSNNSSLLDTRGWVHFKRAEYSQALTELERAAQHSPQSQEIRYHLGMAEVRSGLTDRARSDLESAVAGSANFTGSGEARTVLATLKGPG